MYAKNYQIWLRRFKDESKNVRWRHFFGPRCIRMPSIDSTLFDNGCVQVVGDRRGLGRNDLLLSRGTLLRQLDFCT